MTTFLDFSFKEPIKRALIDLGFETPTPIQSKAIPHILESKQDLLALAQTGTGKTAAFGLPLLQHIDTTRRDLEVIILCPTRELCLQIATDIQKYAKYMPEIKIVSVYGGAPIVNQIRQIKSGVHIVVGTPGRVIDLIGKKVLKLETVKWAVLDEADEMLNMGFVEDISEILSHTPATKQTLLFSATMSKSVERITKKYMNNPLRIEMEATKERDKAITHYSVTVHARDRFLALRRIVDNSPDIYGIIFCRTKRETQEIADRLIAAGYNVGVLHGDIVQDQRTHIMKQFKERHTTLLVATDVAARGIDAPKLTHVIHYGLPEKSENYVHRSGRTGRASEQGISIAIINLHEGRGLRMIERDAEISILPMSVPTRANVITTHLKSFVDKLAAAEVSPADESNKYVADIFNTLEISKDEVALRALTLVVQKILKEHPDQELQEVRHDSGRDSYASRDRGGFGGGRDRERSFSPRGESSSANFTTLEINIGDRDRFEKKDMIRLINDVSRGRRVEIGKIFIRPSFTSFEIPHEEVDALTRALSETHFKHRKIEAKKSMGSGGGSNGGYQSDNLPRSGGFGDRGGRDQSHFPGRRRR